MHWIESTGGPLILIDRLFLSKWGGVRRSSDLNYGSDYERACDTGDYAETISISGGEALILGDEPNRATIISRSSEEIIIVRWRWAPSEKAVQEHLEKLDDKHFENATNLRIRFQGEEAIMFDSSLSGSELDDSIIVKLTPGEYLVETAIYEPDNETCLLLHRLRLS